MANGEVVGRQDLGGTVWKVDQQVEHLMYPVTGRNQKS